MKHQFTEKMSGFVCEFCGLLVMDPETDPRASERCKKAPPDPLPARGAARLTQTQGIQSPMLKLSGLARCPSPQPVGPMADFSLQSRAGVPAERSTQRPLSARIEP